MPTPRTSDLHSTLQKVSGELAQLSKAVEHISNQHHEQFAAIATSDLQSLLGREVFDTPLRTDKARSPTTPKCSKSGNHKKCTAAQKLDPSSPFLGKHTKPVPPLIVHTADDIEKDVVCNLPCNEINGSMAAGLKAEEVADLSVSEQIYQPVSETPSQNALAKREGLGTMSSFNSLPAHEGGAYDEDGAFQWTLWPIWQRSEEEFGVSEVRVSQRMSTVMLGAMGMRSAAFLYRGTTVNGSFVYINKCIINPCSKQYFFWQVLGGLLIVFDVIIVPMQVYDLPRLTVFICFNIAIVCYWMIDCCLQFVTGYELRGSSIEMRPYQIARHYLRTWFLPDILVILADIICLILGVGKQASHSWHISKSRRALRIVRVFRLVRILKMFFLTKRILNLIQSEHLLLFIRICYALGAVMLTCHYAGCYWFGVGNYDTLRNHYQMTWIDAAGIRHASIGTQYIFSLHWALAQSGLATVDIVPTNSVEHLYGSVFTLIWLCLLSVVVSIFVGGVIRIRDANQNQMTQEALMRKYLYLNNVSVELTDRTLRFFCLNYQACLRRVHESDLEFFKELPILLQVSLHREVYVPILRTHSLLRRLGKLTSYICHLVMFERHFNAQERIFQVNDYLDRMFCIIDGRFDYFVKAFSLRPSMDNVEAGEWIGEPCLWIKDWRCCGRLQSVSSSEVVELRVDKFHEILDTSSKTELQSVLEPLLRYARGFLELASLGEIYSDRFDDVQVQRNAYYAFQGFSGGAEFIVSKNSGLNRVIESVKRLYKLTTKSF